MLISSQRPTLRPVLFLLLATLSAYGAQISIPDEYSQYFSQRDHLSSNVNTRVLAASDLMMGKPYQFDSHGDAEGDAFDPRPLYTTESFDCMTFVTTILALVESNNLDDFYRNLRLVRYGTLKPSYFHRHHFISTEWNPANMSLGFIRDITTKITAHDGTPLAQVNTEIINYPNWLLFQKKHFSQLSKWTSQQEQAWQSAYQHSQQELAVLSYIPLSKVFLDNGDVDPAVLQQIPGGSVIEFVTPGWDLRNTIGTKLDVMHLGLVVEKAGIKFLRHAKIRDQVTELPLADYLTFLRDHVPRAQGFHLEKILLLQKP